MRAALNIALTAALGLACADDAPGLQIVPADGFFAPTALDFGAQVVGRTAEQTVRLSNSGASAIALRTLDFEPRLDVFAVRAEQGSVRGRTLAPGQSVDLLVVFGPGEAGRFESELVLATDDVQVSLPVSGTGEVLLDARFEGPPTVTFAGELELGRRAIRPIALRNVGGRPGRIASAPAQGPFSITGPGAAPLGGLPTVQPGEAVQLELHFVPRQPGPARATLVVRDDAGGRLEIEAEGTGVTPGELSCAPRRVDLGGVQRGGSASAAVRCEAVGGPVTLTEVDLERGAAFSLSNLSPGLDVPTTEVGFDVAFAAAGLFSGPRSDTVRLRAAHGVTFEVPVTATVAAPLPDTLDLSVELTWTADVDLDLHLVRGDALPYTAGEDCHWNASTLDWGGPGDWTDDPFLDRDERRGPGAEVVNLAVASGRYQVWVQYFDANGGPRDAPVDFEVRWSLAGGQQTGQRTSSVARCGRMRHVGQVSLPSGAFTAVDQTSDAFAGYTFSCQP